MLEREFQSKLIKKIKNRFEGCIIMKNDPTYIQGIPDLIILYKDKWAALECKMTDSSSHRPNQDYYISKMNKMSYATFISPENEKEVFDELERLFEACW